MSRHEQVAAIVLALSILVSGSTTAMAGRSISSDASQRDTTRTSVFEPEAKVAVARLPIWVGMQSVLAVGRSEWDNNERDGSRWREAFVIQLPAARPNWRSWISVGYEQEQLLVPFTVLTYDSLALPIEQHDKLRVPTSYFSVRVGVDRTRGTEARPWGYAGAGIGYGYGQYAAPWRNPYFAWSGAEATVHAGFYAYPWRSARLGIDARGVVSWRRASEYDTGVLSELLFGLSLEAPLELPKRLVTQP